MKKINLHLVSDSTGETVSSVSRAALVQFEDLDVEEFSWTLVRTRSQMEKVIAAISENPGAVMYTLVDNTLRDMLKMECARRGLPCIAVLSSVVSELSTYLGMETHALPGKQHILNEDYFTRVDAINYALAHDDGQAHWELEEADIVLVGVSRTSKSPTCIYLAYKGYKTANIPFVLGCPLPPSLEQLKKPMVVGLTISPDRLQQIRKTRLLSLKQEEDTNYVDMDHLKEEVAESRKLFHKHKWPVIDVTRRSVEETAATIIQYVRKNNDKRKKSMLSGKAQIAGVIGWPVAHSLSPALHHYWLAQYNIDGAYIPLAVNPEDIAEVIGLLPKIGLRGVNLTLPHKELVLPYLDVVDAEVTACGAANTLVIKDNKIYGYNTDSYGFIENIRPHLPSDKSTAIILGAGGAARAVCHALIKEGFSQLYVCNRSVERAVALEKHFSGKIVAKAWDKREQYLEGANLLVNATSLGMTGKEPLDINLEGLPHTALVMDIVYTPLITPLLALAKARGNVIVDGLGMLLHQAVPGFEAWFGVKPEVTEALRDHLLR